jgi:hypothetical protein
VAHPGVAIVSSAASTVLPLSIITAQDVPM